MGLREYLFSDAIAAVEWLERLREADDLNWLSVKISYAGANRRRIEFSAHGSRYASLLERLQHRFA